MISMLAIDPQFFFHILINVTIIILTIFVTSYVNKLRNTPEGIRQKLRESIFRTLRKIPFIRKIVEKQLEGIKKDLYKSLYIPTQEYFENIPRQGARAGEILRIAEIYNEMARPEYGEGRVSGAVFNRESDHTERQLYQNIFGMFAWSNPLWPKLFPAIRVMEAEVVRMACNMMRGNEDSCGTMTTGGTMSILLACLSHRNRLLKKGIQFPEMIVPTSAHAAFFKAAETFRIKIRKIPLDPINYRACTIEMRKAINQNTCMLVGSAPNFPYGTVDDIEAIGRLGLEFDVPVHVDACLGGFIFPFLEEDSVRYDFRVPGVSSISADSHKYGLAPKGSSVVLYRIKELLHNQYFCESEWPGGIYASATMEGSRSGHNIALCWAAMLYHGRNVYAANARRIVETTQRIRNGLATIKGIQLLGPSNICIVSWTTTEGIELYRFQNFMKERNWQLNALQFPAGVHIMVTMNHTHPGLVESFINDCKDAIQHIKDSPPSESDKNSEAAIYGLAQRIPDRSLVHDIAHIYLDTVYCLKE